MTSAIQHPGSPAMQPAARVTTLLPALLVWLVAALVFILTASNGEPNRISSGYYVILLAPVFILTRGIGPIFRAAESGDSQPIFHALLLFAAANLASTIVTPTEDTIYALLERCLLPLLVYLSLVGIRLSPKDLRTVIVAIALGALVMFVRGILAYYAEFGIPDLQTLVWSRYDTVRISGFEQATVGNVTHMGSYAVLLLPMLMIALVTMVEGRIARATLYLTIGLGLANLVIAGSRAGMLFLALMGIIIAYRFASRLTLIRLGIAVAVTGLALLIWAMDPSNTHIVERFAPGANGHADGSLQERLQSMIIGWNVFLDNALFGVGPAMSEYYNTFSIPHQSILHQLSELGLVGGVAFGWLNVVVLRAFAGAVLAARNTTEATYRLLWLIGPAAWLIMGLAAGIVFNMSLALVWVGIAHAMLALGCSTPAPDESNRPALSLMRLYRGLNQA